MKVKELIKELEKHDSEAEVVTELYLDDGFDFAKFIKGIISIEKGILTGGYMFTREEQGYEGEKAVKINFDEKTI